MFDGEVPHVRAESDVNFSHTGTTHIRNLDGMAGGSIHFGLVNLLQEADNEVDFARVKGGAVANFNSGGAGTNHVKSLDTEAGGVLNFGLINLL